MLTQIRSVFSLSKSQQGYVVAYGAVIFSSVFLTMLVMAGVQGEAAVPVEPSNYAAWIMLSGAVAGAVAMIAARGWFGMAGALGHGRAVVGGFAVTVIGAVVAGMMVAPVQGAFYAPVMLATVFVERPIFALLWAAVLGVAHVAMLPRYRHQDLLKDLGTDYVEEQPTSKYATSQLSSLTRANLYHER